VASRAISWRLKRIDDTLVKALARAHRWRRMLEEGEYVTLRDLARREDIGWSYISRLLRLTLLAPDITERILDGQQPRKVTLAELMKPLPMAWEEQRRLRCAAIE
jgi:hypothetical protein